MYIFMRNREWAIDDIGNIATVLASSFPFLMSYLPYTLIKSFACPVNVLHLLWHTYLPLNTHIWQIIKFESSSDISDDELNKTNMRLIFLMMILSYHFFPRQIMVNLSIPSWKHYYHLRLMISKFTKYNH